MESVSAQVVVAVKLPEVILNGKSPVPTRVIDSVKIAVPTTTTEQKLARKNKLKARGTLLMALPNEHQLKFNTYKTSKSLMEAIEKRPQKLISQLEIHGETISQEDLNMKLLRSLPSEWKTHTLIWRNKSDLEDLSMDDFTGSTNEAVNTTHGVSSATSKANASTLPNVDSLSDVEMDWKWQMAMLTIRARRFLKKTRRTLVVNRTDTIGFDKTKVECYNCHKRGPFARECRAPKNQDSRNRETTRRIVPVEETSSKALVSQCSSSSSSSNTEVSTCSKACLESVKARLDVYKKNEAIFEDDIKILKLDVMLRDNALTELRKKFEKAEKERDDLKLTLEKFQNSSKNLGKLLDSQVSDKFKSGLGYDNQVNDSQMFDSQVNDMCKTGEGYHVVPPPYTGNFMPPKLDFLLADENECVFSEPFNKYSTDKNSNFNVKVNTIKENVTTVGLKVVVSDNKGNEANVVKASACCDWRPKQKFLDHGNPQIELQDKEVIDNGCSRHMTGNKSYLSDYEEIYGGIVAFGRNSKGCKNTGKSVSQMCDKKNNVLFTNNECVVLSSDFKLLDENQVLLRVPRKNNMYSVDLKNIIPSRGLTCLFAKATLDESNLWHRRLGHINFKTMNKLDETSGILKAFITGIENQTNHRVKIIRCDNGTEFKNKKMNQFCEMKEIKREFSVARTPQKNGVAERKNRILIEAARTMLANSMLPITFWAEVVNTACYVHNRVLVIKPHNKTPYELFNGRPPTISFIRPFRYHVTILNTLDHLEPKKVIQALTDPSRIEAMQDELLQFKLQKVWTLVDLPNGKRAIGTKWVFRNKKDERGTVVRNKARLVAQGYTQEEGIDYEEVFASVVRIEAIRLFLTYASFKDFVVYQIDVKSAFLYGKIEEEVNVCQPPGFEDPKFPEKVYKVEKALYGLHQALRAWYETLSTYLLENRFKRGTIDKTLFIKKVKGDILLVQIYVDYIIFGSTKKELCTEFETLMHKSSRSMIGLLMYLTAFRPDIMFDVCACARFQVTPKDSPFDLKAYSDSDYAGASLDRKSTTGEYVAAANCCGQVLWIQNQILDYGYNFIQTKIFIDNESTICIVKNPVFHSKTKHIKIRHHFIRDSYEKRLIQVIKIHTDQNVADLLTKAFDVSRFKFLTASIEMLNLKRVYDGKGYIDDGIIAKDGIEVNTVNSRVNAVGHTYAARLLTAARLLLELLLLSEILATLTFADSYNMVAYLEKSIENADFDEIFWSTAKTRTVNNETQIRAKVDGKTIVITESSVRRDLHFDDEDVICLAKAQKVNFSTLVFDGMLRNLDLNSKKFLMYPRFLQVFLNNQIENLTPPFNDEYNTPSHTKKVFANMRRKGKDFSGTMTPLFATMLIQQQAVEGEGSGQPFEPQHTPTTASPSHESQIPISSGPTIPVADETVHKERGNKVERAATSASSLRAEQASGSGPRCQETTLEDRPAQTRFERLSKQSNDPPLSRVNTLRNGEDNMKLMELMEICTKLFERVLALENIKTVQALEITHLKKRVKKLERKKKSKTPQLKRRLFKVRIESSAEKSLGDQEDASKQGRNISEVDQDESTSWFKEDTKT
ncbi:putative ribonuclease H-like domain-containing protein [Tanacetum coccineum]